MKRDASSIVLERFSNDAARTASACFGCLVVLLGLAGLDHGERVAILYIVAGVAFAYRGRQSATVLLTPSEVVLRGFVRSRHFVLTDIASVEVAVGRVGMNGFGRQYLVVRRHDGSAVPFKELNAKPAANLPTVVQDAARAINRAVTS